VFKRVFIYGIAFGSLSASMLLVQYLNGLYKTVSVASFFPMFFNLVIPGIGVYLFVKGLMNMQTDKPINMGKALFFSLMMSLIMAATNIAAYQHIYYNKTEIIEDWRSLQFAAIEKNIDADTSVLAVDKPKQKAMMKDNFNVKISPSSFGSFELMMCVSTSMVVALLVFVWNLKRNP
jgi:hypothetical protein